MSKRRWLLVFIAVVLSALVSGGGVFLYFDNKERKAKGQLEDVADSISDLRSKLDDVVGGASGSIETLKNDIEDFDYSDWRDVVPEVRSDVESLVRELDEISDAVASLDSDISLL